MELTDKITVNLVQHMGSDAMVVAAAQVSTKGQEAEKYATEEAKYGLINYLMKHRHGTPFEHGAMTFFVHAPIFVWREWHRHRIGFSYNEESGRYKVLEPVFYIPPDDRPLFKVDDWKPGRPKFLTIEEYDDIADPDMIGLKGIDYDGGNDKLEQLKQNLMTSYESAYKAYLDNLELGIDPGLARDCLPTGIYSSCWVTANPRSIMAFLSLRTHDPEAKFVSYPLYEIEQAARQVEAIFSELWPLTYKAFCENGRVAP